jgi:crotonobetainyl-CoA:carnitine CoA-transferase CaiB-like acyl-CoA transferase
MRHNLSLGDSLAGFHTAFGILLAIIERRRSRKGQIVDVALTEAVFNMLESVVPEYDRCGVVRQPSGSTITGVVPTNTYPCQDGKYVIIGGNGESIYKRLMETAGRSDLAGDPHLATNAGRVERQQEIDAAIGEWTVTLPLKEVLDRLEDAAVPAGPIQSVAEIFADPQFQARGMFEEVEVGGRPLKLPAIVPKLTETPGRTDWAGPDLGAHNREIFGELLGLSEAEIDELQAAGVI